VRHIHTVVLDQARTQESRTLLRRFENSEDFQLVGEVFRDEDLSQAIVAGKARVGIQIPEDYSSGVWRWGCSP
jgi:ABC-2 type transport system permease protein